jgi:nitroimidazol reductase NimA-like FMN-containing flavoprotein (pyridoxamine 5'-phosphate oxidase superfamily)
MSENDVRSLGHEECLALLRQGGLGRLADSGDESPTVHEDAS